MKARNLRYKRGTLVAIATACVFTLSGCMNPVVEVEVIVEEVNVTIPIDDVSILDDGCIEFTYDGVTDITCEDYAINNGIKYENQREGK